MGKRKRDREKEHESECMNEKASEGKIIGIRVKYVHIK